MHADLRTNAEAQRGRAATEEGGRWRIEDGKTVPALKRVESVFETNVIRELRELWQKWQKDTGRNIKSGNTDLTQSRGGTWQSRNRIRQGYMETRYLVSYGI
jgi:hypothetical protein